MTKNDLEFLKALGIKPEEIVPSDSVVVQFGNPGVFAYETCPDCGRKRHRFIEDGYVFCLSCSARKQREARYNAALARANSLPNVLRYRGFEITHLDGVGWCYRMEGVEAYKHWMKANSLLDAELRVDRIAAAYREEPEPKEPFVPLNRCRDCDAPCGHLRYCGPCGRAHYL